MEDIITITSWTGTRKMNRKDAINFYLECMALSMGAEREHYVNIYLSLLGGKTSIYE